MGQGVYFSQVIRRILPYLALPLAIWCTSSYSQIDSPVAASTCPSFSFAAEPFKPQRTAVTEAAAAQAITARLQPGLLKPQVESLIKQGFDVEYIDWRASPHYRWSTHFEFAADDWQRALTKILQPYQLQLTLYANHMAVVAPTAQVQ
ncbi:hypothetical protein [Pseudidiomarina sp. CB1]|uniref:hypothetical protein n=1 Tax=Pseudidiomarina sp. CB1 TaxID=2972484 RepID=UPI0021619704|nr:hypothetical protein [Pseudidiomarina sp. CB1]